MSELVHILKHSVVITIFVFGMMLITDYLNVLSRGKMASLIRGGRWRQYTTASFLGATPGCLGAFMNVSFYVHGLIGFGAIVGGMIATSGDEAFVMLALFPKTALLLFLLLFALGIVLAWLTDKVAPLFKVKPSEECEVELVHESHVEGQLFGPQAWRRALSSFGFRFTLFFLVIILVLLAVLGLLGPPSWNVERGFLLTILLIIGVTTATVSDHYLKEHIWRHIIKEHLWRVFLWTLFALLVVQLVLHYWDLGSFVEAHMVWVLVLSALVAVIPESGPHLVFVMMFTQGLVPFSVLLTSSIVQDGHGMLPLLSYSVRDTVKIKLFNLVYGLLIGGALYLIGL
ncbi:MAG: selenocysteine protein [candidate division Zixibacteria bacterium DG_27]|nr:MAG: selenocysteine protein [candidate division Zixibacteria bacterium DG_27]